MNEQSQKTFLLNTAYTVTVGVIVYFVFRFLFFYLTPFIIGFAVAFLAQKPAELISEKLKIPKKICAVGLSAAVFLIIGALTVFLCWLLIFNANGILSYLSRTVSALYNFTDGLGGHFEKITADMPGKIKTAFSQMWNGWLKNISRNLSSALSRTGGLLIKRIPFFIFAFIVSVISCCYFAADFKRLCKFFMLVSGKERYRKIIKIKNILFNKVLKMLKGYLIIALITFAVMGLWLFVLRVKNAVLISAAVAFIDFLPVLGSGMVLIPWGIFCIATGSISRGIGLIVLYFVLLAVKNITEPKIISNQIGMNPLFTLIAMFMGYKILGFSGLFVFPVALIVTVEYFKNCETEGTMSTSTVLE